MINLNKNNGRLFNPNFVYQIDKNCKFSHPAVQNRTGRHLCKLHESRSDFYRVRRTKLLVRHYLFPLKRIILGLFLLSVIWVVHRTSMVHSVNNTPLVFNGGRPSFCAGPGNKYDPELIEQGCHPNHFKSIVVFHVQN